MNTDLLYQLALTQVPNIGDVQAKILAEEFGTAEAIFKAKKSTLEKIEGIGEVRASSIKKFDAFNEQEDEIKFIEKYKIKPLFLTSDDYPKRLLHCYDPPTLLFYRGNANLNTSKIISIIGTRSNSDYGKMMTEKILASLAPHQPLVVSGLAYGIDAIAHKQSLKQQLPTVAVLAHGLDKIYPSQHTALAKEMIAEGGGILTEFRKDTKPDRHNFPERNRIVAGMCDATIVIETGIKGGSMITANLAYSYNRDVFAVPGKTTDSKSEGCNYLIQSNKAILIRNGEDVIKEMGWEEKNKKKIIQKQLFVDLTADEKIIAQLLQVKEQMHIDEINLQSNINSSSVSAALLMMEMNGLVKSLPGKIYKLS
ncbi:DNA-processing protein DprA [Lacibacter sediminis]|uniref:DNA-protecting protein DprA n=1 Tax=Lacibacter sediminis TaxID=2760713 RepID=A0A7G5XJX1_9BACT|nr:DNA-processing protein DprA [Lacibacter sediminis]QNA45774.1 DNA-protecting protein DprA [Lacibacter sediminis]